MAISLPHIEFPWTRKKTKVAGIELPHIELPKVDGTSIERAKSRLPKVDTARLAETSAATIAAVADQAAERAGQLGHEATKVSRDLAEGSEANLRALGTDLKELTKDVRSLRITRQKQGPDTLPGIALLGGLGAGLAAMYFFDPEQGRRRRALLRDQLVKWSRITSETLSGKAEDLRNRSAGLAHEARSALESASEGGDGSEWSDSVVDTTPEAASQLEATDAAAGMTGQNDNAGGVYSTSEYDPALTGDQVTETQPTGQEEIYGGVAETVTEVWGTGEPGDEGRREH
jgi:hypothetical protein